MNLLTHSFLRSHVWLLSLIPHILTISKSYRPHMGIYAESNHCSPHLPHILSPGVTISCPDHSKHLLSGLPASNFASLHPEWVFWNIKQIIPIFFSESPNGFPSHLRSYSKPFFKALCDLDPITPLISPPPLSLPSYSSPATLASPLILTRAKHTSPRDYEYVFHVHIPPLELTSPRWLQSSRPCILHLQMSLSKRPINRATPQPTVILCTLFPFYIPFHTYHCILYSIFFNYILPYIHIH